MKKRHLVPLVAVVAGTLAAPAAVAASPAAAPTKATSTSSDDLGDRSLAAVLTADGNQFDRNWSDYDILTEAVLAVVAAKPDSPVGLLTQGDVPLTAFIPNDRAFQFLAKDLTGKWYGGEKQVFDALVGAVGVDAIEQVLLYHVIPGATITSADALNANKAQLNTALPGTSVTVKVISKTFKLIELKDNDPNDLNPIINKFDINKGNKQIAHGIIFVLRPADL